MTPDQLFLAHLPHIKKVVAQTCRHCHFRKEEAEDFSSKLTLKILDNDYAVIRQFQGKSTLKHYLTMVIKRYMLDFQNELWGKWRPSKEAERLGPVAVLLEKLLVRDGLSFDEAVNILQTNHKVKMTWQELDRIAGRLPHRTPRHMEGEETLESVPSPNDRADGNITEKEKNALRVRAHEALRQALLTIPKEAKVIIQLQWKCFSVAQISRTLGLDQKQLYRRIQKTQEHLRREMERHGIRKEDIQDLFDE
jgi:RNA polymerase sigma factor for flagellar operon FliA